MRRNWRWGTNKRACTEKWNDATCEYKLFHRTAKSDYTANAVFVVLVSQQFVKKKILSYASHGAMSTDDNDDNDDDDDDNGDDAYV